MNILIMQLEHRDIMTKAERIRRVSDAVSQLADSDLIMLPELWNTGFFSYERYKQNSEDIYGETCAALSALAKEKRSYIFTGSFIESRRNKLYNTALLLDRSGNIAARYSKIHLFGDEKMYFTPGSDICTAETDFGTVGLSLCYDLRFPELYRRLSAQGAEVLLSGYALPASRLNHWRILTPARALENQAFFFSCGCVGVNNGITYSGHSMAVSPYGNIIGEGGSGGSIVSVHADIAEARKYRKSFPALSDRLL